MMFGNSFMLGLDAIGFQRYFSTVHQLYDLNYLGNVFTKIPTGTKIVIWQMFELEIAYQLQSDSYWLEVDRAMTAPSSKRQP